MTLPLWGQQEKAQDNSQTIDEAISAAIVAHEADSEAHLGVDESLEKHKTEEMIDHPAGCIAVDKFSQAHFLVTAFESLDGWADFMTGTATRVSDFGSVQLTTGTTTGSENILYAAPSVWTPFDSEKEFYWRAVVKLTSITNQSVRIGIGALGAGDGLSGAGYQIEDGTLYAYIEDDQVVVREAISGITLTDFHIYEVRNEPSTNTFTYYIDGTLVDTKTVVLTETQDDFLAVFKISNTAAEAKYLYISDMQFQIER